MRRIFLLLTLALLLVCAAVAEAQQPAKVPRIGILTPDLISARANLFEAFRQGLHDRGYFECKNIAIEIRSAEGKLDRLPTLARELVSLKVDVTVTGPTPISPSGYARNGN